jgi:hypothetical protein
MAEARIVEPPRFCARCGSPVVVVDASYCKECGAPLAATVWLNQAISWRPWTALLLSVLPGLGQWYKGQRLRGVIWFLVVLSFYGLQPVGLMLHIICACNAALSGALKEDHPTRWSQTRGNATRSGGRPT